MQPSRSLAALALLSLAGLAQAQLVTPPESAPAKTEPLPMPAQDSFQPDVQPSLPPVRNTPPVDAIPPEIDNKWEKLAKRDANGKVIRLTVGAEEAALRINPALSPEQRQQAEPYLAERRARIERILIENLDIVDDLTGERLNAVDVSDKVQLKWLTEALTPFKPPSAPQSVSAELLQRGIFNPMQAKVNSKISKEYNDEVRREIMQGAGGGNNKAAMLKSVAPLIREEAMGEAFIVLRQLKIEAASNLGAILPKLGLDSGAMEKARSAAKVTPSSSDADKVAAIDALKDVLTLDQRKELLRQAAALHAPKKDAEPAAAQRTQAQPTQPK